MEHVIPTCYACGTAMELKTKGTDKFWGCPNWKTCGGKTIPFKGERQKDKPAVVRKDTPNPQLLIMEELVAVNKRLDKLGEFLQEKLK